MTIEELAALSARAREAPDDLALQIQAAYANDRHGTEEDAVVFYDRAYPRRGELPDDERWPFLVGYGSTLRNVGRLGESRAVLEAAVAEWPENGAFPAFLALTLLDEKEPARAVALLLDALLRVGKNDAGIGRYARALAFYRDELRRSS